MKFAFLASGLIILGAAAGVGAAWIMPSAPPPDALTDDTPPELPVGEPVYVNLQNQFVVPIVEDGIVRAMVVVTLSIETTAQDEDRVRMHEPRLRDQFLQVLFNHANTGKFGGLFTNPAVMGELRQGLLARAQDSLGTAVRDVLIVDILRQDS